MSQLPVFQRYTIYTDPPAEQPTCLVGDVNNDGAPEIVIATRNPQPQLHWFGRTASDEWEPYLIDNT